MPFKLRVLIGLFAVTLLSSAIGGIVEAVGAPIHWWAFPLFFDACFLTICLGVYLLKRKRELDASQAAAYAAQYQSAREFTEKPPPRDASDPRNIVSLEVIDGTGRVHHPVNRKPVVAVVKPRKLLAALATFDVHPEDANKPAALTYRFQGIVVKTRFNPGQTGSHLFVGRVGAGDTIADSVQPTPFVNGGSIVLADGAVEVFFFGSFDDAREKALELNGVTRAAQRVQRPAIDGAAPHLQLEGGKPDTAARN